MAKRSRQVYIDDEIWREGRAIALWKGKTMSAYIEALLFKSIRENDMDLEIIKRKLNEPHKTS